jgi:outer membrane protein OmpA-like peptidoglycan-associated protein
MEPMKKGKKYCITFWYKLASYSQICVDQLSFYITNEQILTRGDKALGGKPQFKNKDGLFLDNIREWKRVCHVYTAKGGEKFFTVGNFKNYDNTNYVITDKNIRNLRNKAYAYYYFDDFVVRQLVNCKDCPCVQHDFRAAIIDTFYTGGLDPISGTTDKIINDGRIKVSLMGGTKPYQVKWSNGATGTSLNNLPAGTYTYVATDKYNCRATGTVTFVEPELTDDEFEEGLKNIEEGEAIVLENIFFEFNKTTLLDESHASLDEIISFLKANDLKLIEISGHTDNEGSDKYNQDLSEGRAQAVVDYLVENGIAASRLMAKGYGESRPIETNITEEGRALNRRVEFRLLRK